MDKVSGLFGWNFVPVNPQESASFLLWKANNEMQAKLKAKLQRFGLTYVQYIVLATLVHKSNKTVVNQRQLAHLLGIDIMMTSQVVRRLEAKLLVTRQKNLIDNRAWTVRASPKAWKLIYEVQKAIS